MLEFILIMFIGLLGVLLVRYHVAVRNFSQQIREKRETGSQIRLTPQYHGQTIIEVANEVEKLFQEVEQTRFIARQEKKTLDMAISNIAHDIRTPLTIASGYTQQLIKEKEENKQLLKIATNLSVVSNRLEALMEYRRLMEGAVRPQFRQIDISKLVAKQMLPFYDAFQKQGIELQVNLQEGLVIKTDPEILERIVQNMLSNVLKHGKETAQLSLIRKDAAILLSVKNIVRQPIQHLEKLTNRFYSENLSSTEESSGLGLYITQQLVDILGGDLTMKAEGEWFGLLIRL
ncbi:HAMP domain-containing sensor histidine kinase [Streptococcus sp. IsoGale021]|uniref:sensor histidine kinase n=1 Tax=Streptococcus TaxID=1301 RepID=UPI002001421E|nr:MULTISPECIES: HAMP domain-containing sensor histidine kinase [Streptococcus]MCY7209698.1 HAMP domain-containing histidine kinase [Streptococcus anginosus]MCY7211549.1 HAMP domain-containing histidine kinase [Streptococcus anginosus]MCY7226676.1 HAMP domain-containing histidine kinase [Streptococcus anginosus]MDQ8693764.1 HAMP domain-containing sensor histidine kinase [Streptococcus sp. IsoGale021]MDU5129095.1 HAMP domain-containing sensor histidine kinase [Streptococcus anginosus]